MKRSLNNGARLLAVGLAGSLLLAGCSGQSTTPDSPSGGANSGAPVNLKVNFWGDFGLDKLKAVYEAANPNVKITLNSGEYNAQHEDLQKKIVAGNGAPDISAIDEGF
ncbi:MAG TPA: ABC transporter substrate-binding protein, partial [Actinoplanes sp.]